VDVIFAGSIAEVDIRPGIRVSGLQCAFSAEAGGIVLSWTVPSGAAAAGFGGVVVYRNSELIRPMVPARILTVTDTGAPAHSRIVYDVVAVVHGTEEACRASCSIELGEGSGPFLRGDANLDTRANLADGAAILQHLFLGGEIGCRDAGDFNDNGVLELTDATNLLKYLFQGGPPPSPPFPNAGPDPTADSLGCDS
jgi:hypothetical protein